MSAPNLSTIQAATLTWAQANTNAPGNSSAAVDPELQALHIATNTPVWNQIFDAIEDLNNKILSTTAYALGMLTLTPGGIVNDEIVIDGVYYQFASNPTSDASADGTSSHPWQVAVGATDALSLSNLYAAINASGVGGTNYSTALTAHPTVSAVEKTTTSVTVQAKANGTTGNAITTTVTSVSPADGLAWGGATLSGGAGDSASAQAVVDDWRDGLRSVPLLLDDDAAAELDGAIAALKTGVAALFT